MTDETYIRASKIQTAVSMFDKAIEYLEKINTINSITFENRDWGPNLDMNLFLLSDNDCERLIKRLLTAFKDERDLLKAEYEEL